MLYNRPPMRSPQTPGYVTGVPNRQTIPAISAMGQPQLQTSLGSSSTNQGQSPGGQGSSNIGIPSSSNYAPPPSSLQNSSIPKAPEQGSQPADMTQWNKSQNMSTLLRALIGRTT